MFSFPLVFLRSMSPCSKTFLNNMITSQNMYGSMKDSRLMVPVPSQNKGLAQQRRMPLLSHRETFITRHLLNCILCSKVFCFAHIISHSTLHGTLPSDYSIIKTYPDTLMLSSLSDSKLELFNTTVLGQVLHKLTIGLNGFHHFPKCHTWVRLVSTHYS